MLTAALGPSPAIFSYGASGMPIDFSPHIAPRMPRCSPLLGHCRARAAARTATRPGRLCSRECEPHLHGIIGELDAGLGLLQQASFEQGMHVAVDRLHVAPG